MTTNDFIQKLRRRIYRTQREKALLRWYGDKGDASLRVNYDLSDTSLVTDVGGFEGDWAAEIFARYACNITVFEPVARLAAGIRARFARNPRITIHSRGLGGKSREESIGVAAHCSSIFKPEGALESVQIWDVAEWVTQDRIKTIDLMKINIEGGEYELLERMIEMDLVKSVTNLQVQFHDFVPDAITKRNRIREVLALTHVCTYDYPFVWENWAIKTT